MCSARLVLWRNVYSVCSRHCHRFVISLGFLCLCNQPIRLNKMLQQTQGHIVTEPTEDGLFLAYFSHRATCYAYGETESEAREQLLDRFDFSPEGWADFDEYTYLACALG